MTKIYFKAIDYRGEHVYFDVDYPHEYNSSEDLPEHITQEIINEKNLLGIIDYQLTPF